MKKLAKNAFILLFPISLIFFYMDLRLGIDLPNVQKTKRVNLEASLNTIQVLAMGDSHIWFGIDPDIFPVNAYNLGTASTDLYDQQFLIDTYVHKMPNLRIILLNISYFTLESKHEYTPNDWSVCQISREYKFLPENLLLIPKYNFCSSLLQQDSNPFTSIMGWVDYVKHDHSKSVQLKSNGWYKNEKIMVPDQEKARERVKRHESNMNPNAKSINIGRVIHINNELKERNIKLVLLTIPQSKLYYENVSPERYNEIQKDIYLLSQNYSIPYFNYFRDNRFTDEDFWDVDHLNVPGALKFSQIVNEDIIQPLLVP